MHCAYKGWIPTITGRLSFRLIGRSLHPTRSVFENKSDERDRFVVAYQGRDLNNALIPRSRPRTGKFRFVIIGRSTNETVARTEPLVGTIFVFFTRERWKESVDGNISAELIVKSAQTDLRQFDPETGGSLAQFFSSKFEQLHSSLKPLASCHADFILERNGELSLGVIEEGNVLVSAFPEADIQRAVYTHKLANEIYFFLKDITHKHQHHDPRSDTTLTVFKYDNTDEWVIHTFRSLRYHVISEKREQTESGYSDALGFLAYKRTFVHIMKNRIVALIKSQDELDKDANAELSINAKLEEMRLRNDRHSSRREYLFATVLGVLGAFLAWGQIVSGKEFSQETALGQLQSFLINDAPIALGGMLSVAVLVLCIGFRKSHVLTLPYALFYRVFTAVDKKYLVGLLGIIFILLVIAFFALT